MVVFSDRHHGALTYSLQLLFEKRLGHELYFPIGMEWFDAGYWKIGDPYPNPRDTAQQYLNTEHLGYQPYKHINANTTEQEEGLYKVYDPVHEVFLNCITLDRFKKMEIDIVISSYQPHDESFARLIREFKPRAKHIAQMGNTMQTTDVANVMCSTKPYPTNGKNVVFYHQEINTYPFVEPDPKCKKIKSFVNVLPQPEIFDLYKSQLRDFEVKAYGASCPDGTISGEKNLIAEMRDSTFGFHNKPGSDGFGHVIFNWFNVGRPVIVNYEEYKSQLAGELLIPDQTCISLDSGDGFNRIIEKIRYYSQADIHKEMCERAYKRFREVVDYEAETERIKEFLNNLERG